ncbi:EAL domain, c-di-GMP-specific phosphodiesterase class I (or its enzymatically inactive variant) [Pelagibacterium halotolerans]|uniref:EAL domain protein n=1 Tax=Pelagibacterium halotolerans (strain DSM 22347 / JCM 15775 / CGMCC 1.7692 / B2) TaxID=1082931 RepID=G4RB99_PELHB|nr:EAL domain protein [Pelagibacterium halotolerans B2]SEA17780.1 EAL domain, c-di-GMP-specific phosphodiesterase class I (or its enzymatically inactive variant) [Pelagibacterium halotolerans]
MRVDTSGHFSLRSRFSQIVLLVVALLAFLPVVAVDHVIDGYVQARETGALQTTVDAITHDSQVTVHEGIQSLRRILANSPSLCAATFIQNVNSELEANPFLRQVLVENHDGVQYCSAFGRAVDYRVLSESLTIPGHTETLSVVKIEGSEIPLLKITQAFGRERTVSALVLATPMLMRKDAPLLGQISYLQVALTSGSSILLRGDERIGQGAGRDDYLFARSFAGEIPLKAEAGLSFSQVRSEYSPLDVGFTVAACFMGALILVLAIQYARKADIVAFDLERAIIAGEMKPYYQPVINLKTGKLIGCEVLIRWVKKNGEIIPPGAFIDYAEMSGLAIPMTLSLMEQVRYDLEDICREVPDFKVSINLFEGHFRDGSIVEDIQSVFEGSGISYRQLVFEITERRPLDDRNAANRVMSAMHKLGVRIAMDDAGTGHSNLAYLQTLGIDIVKIDKIFVEMIKDASQPVPVVDALISMAKDLDIDIIAEGVETQEQALYLRSKNVVFAQGYLFAPPMKLSSFLVLANALRPGVRESNLEPGLAA